MTLCQDFIYFSFHHVFSTVCICNLFRTCRERTTTRRVCRIHRLRRHNPHDHDCERFQTPTLCTHVRPCLRRRPTQPWVLLYYRKGLFPLPESPCGPLLTAYLQVVNFRATTDTLPSPEHAISEFALKGDLVTVCVCLTIDDKL